RLPRTLLERLPALDRLVSDHVPDPRFGVEQNPLQDLFDHRPQATGSSATLRGDPGDLLDRRIGKRQIRSVKPDQFSELLNQRILRTLKNPSEILNTKGIQRSDHRQPPDNLWDQPELFEVFWLDLPQQKAGRVRY